MMLRFGLDLDDPEAAELFIEGVGVRTADGAITEQERCELERLG
ncbi:hypothetical protein [Sorangium sp. So ce1182]